MGARTSRVVMSEDFLRVLRYAEKWGVEVLLHHEPISPDDVYIAPASHAWIVWPARIIHWDDRECTRPTDPSALLHELAHCLDRWNPHSAREVTGPMLAFEYWSHRFLRLGGWYRWMDNYGMPDGWDWPQSKDRMHYLERSFRKAVQVGTLTPEGKPTFRRPPWMKQAA